MNLIETPYWGAISEQYYALNKKCCELAYLESEVKNKGLVPIDECKEFAKTTIYSYEWTLNFVNDYGFLPS